MKASWCFYMVHGFATACLKSAVLCNFKAPLSVNMVVIGVARSRHTFHLSVLGKIWMFHASVMFKADRATPV